MRVLVCGGRDYENYELVYQELEKMRPSAVIEGGATGADHAGKLYAQDKKIERLTFRADWEKYGLSAGPKRNQRMIDEGKPDLVLAFPGGKGTADMVRRAERAGVPVHKPIKS